MKKSKRNIATAVLLAGALGLAVAGGVSAYLTDYDKAENPFVVGQVKIELQEPGWNPDDHKTMEPGKQIQKDPQIKNTGTNDAFVYLEVGIPMKEVTEQIMKENGWNINCRSCLPSIQGKNGRNWILGKRTTIWYMYMLTTRC